MTACNNNVRGGKASRVITAALVATLSVGTPMAAIASTVSEGGIDMLATDAENVKQATVSYDGEDGASFVYDEETHGLVPTSLKLANGTVVDDIELLPAATSGKRKTGNYYYYYYAVGSGATLACGSNGEKVQIKNADGDYVDLTGNNVYDASRNFVAPSAIGEYAVVVGEWTGSGFNYVGTAASFSITAKDLSGASIYEIHTDADGNPTDDVSDTTFNYDGTEDSLDADKVASKIGVAVDGVALNPSDYSVSIYSKGGYQAESTLNVGETYIVKINGEGNYDNEYKECELVINKLDLATADIDVKTIVEQPGHRTIAPSASSKLADLINSINDVDVVSSGSDTDKIISDGNSDIVVSFVKDPNGYQTSNATRGEYTYTISAGKDSDKVTGSKTIKVLYADYKADIDFGQGAGDELAVDLSAEKVSYFDADKIAVTYKDSTMEEHKIDSEDYTVSYTDKDGKTVDASALRQPGDYKVTVTVNKKIDGVVVAGTKTLDVNVSYGTIAQNADVFVSYDGENVDGSKSDLVYTGEDLAKNITVLAKAGEKTFAEGTDYEIQLQKVVDGKNVDVDSMIDAGTYKLTVKALNFKIDGDSSVTFNFVVAPITVDEVVVDYALVDSNTPANSCFPYTGDVITPSFKFYVADPDGDVTISNSTYTEVEVPSDAYTVEYTNAKGEKAELKETGVYTAVLKTAKNVENYVVSDSVSINVSDENVMNDVPNTAWYAQAVLDAKNRNLMMGIEGTKFFAPLQSLNRGQVAIVLYRMAGSPATSTTPGSGDTTGSWDNQNFETGFSDVASNSYYAQEIAWAKTAGVVNGNPDGTFAPDASISRQQFAIMLANYAKTIGKYQAVDTDAVLANVAGGDEVEGYARDAVAWAVSNGLMAQGADVNPLGTIDRAQAATMLVRFDDFVKGETK